MSGKLFLLKFVVRQLDLGRSIFGKRAERVISVKNGDFLIASKMRSIRFMKLRFMHPKMIHRAVFCATF